MSVVHRVRPTFEHQSASGIEHREPWICEPVFCRCCAHEWNAVRTLKTDHESLECPFCGVQDSAIFELNDQPRRHVRH